MNIVQKLTLRHIKSHLRRSVLTVLAIIVSVAMVTAVFTSAVSFLKFMQDSTQAYDGNWHVQFTYDGQPKLEAFENNSDIADYYVSAEYTEISCNAASDSSRVRCDLDTVDPSVVDIRNINITQGRFPEKEGELLLKKEYIENNKLNWKVGDTLTIPTRMAYSGEFTDKEYTLVGIAEGNVSYFDHCGGCLLNTGSFPKEIVSFVTVSFKELNSSVYEKSSALSEASGAESYKTNYDLLAFSGVMKNNEVLYTLGAFVAVILTVIIIASVVMIYDSFAVSYQERERYLGMLASVGATKRQKRSSIYFEGFLLGLIAIPIGIAAGFIGMAITFKSIEGVFLSTVAIPIKNTLRVHINPYIILGSVFISALTILISCYIPARRASKTTPIAAIKGTNTVKVKKAKSLKVSKLTKKLYGYEGELAVKNFKRNGRRSRNIVFALVMSVVLFMTVTNFAVMLDMSVTKQTGGTRADFTVTVSEENMDKAEAYLSSARIKSYTGYANVSAKLKNRELLTDIAQEKLDNDTEEDILLFCLDNDSFDRYLKKLGEDPQEYHDKTAPKAVIFNQIIYLDNKTEVKADALVDADGKVLQLEQATYDSENEEPTVISYTVTAGTVTKTVSGDSVFLPENWWAPSAILPADTFFTLLHDADDGFISYAVYADNYKTVLTQTEDYFEEQGIWYSVQDNGANLESVKALTTILKVFIYGFISLITLIAVINIINSIANSMNERKTEFAMLKSVGVTPKGFKKMIYVESLRYGMKSLLWSIPISAGLHYLMYYALSGTEETVIPFTPNLQYYTAAILAVFIIIVLSLLYSADKIKDDNIIENLKQD